jgi:23S rRNA pseudouridine2605 synthase
MAKREARCPGVSAACLAGGDLSRGRSLLPNQTGGIVLGGLSSVNRVIIPHMEERLQKILARAGLGSRRACEELITAGRVRVNGQAVQLGSKADPDVDTITLDGRKVAAAEALVYVAVYKPRGVLSAVEAPDPRPTVRSLIPLSGTLYPVGRLDVDSEGLILLTNDGELTNRLTHPRYGHEKEYRVLVARRPDREQLEAIRHGIVLEDGHRTLPAVVNLESSFGKGAWLRITLREGRKRQIREMCALVGLPVVSIIRIRIGTLLLGSLKPRGWRLLTEKEVAELKGKPGIRKPGNSKLKKR